MKILVAVEILSGVEAHCSPIKKGFYWGEQCLMDDLKKMLKSAIIPREYELFIKALPVIESPTISGAVREGCQGRKRQQMDANFEVNKKAKFSNKE